MTISLYGYLIFLVTLTVAAAVPGPGVATVIARTLSHGAHAGLLVTTGIICGDIAWLTVAILGLAAIAKTFAAVFLVVKYLGAAYLLYLAWKLWQAPPQTVDLKEAGPRGHKLSNIWIGLSVTLSNPKTIMFYMAVLPTLLDIGHVGFNLYFILAATIACVLVLVFTGYVFLAIGIKQVFRSGSAIRALHRGTGLIMAGAAAMIASR